MGLLVRALSGLALACGLASGYAAARATAPEPAPVVVRVPRAHERKAPIGFDRPAREAAARPIFVRGPRGGNVLAYAPPEGAPLDAPTILYLHGIRGRAENGCPWMRTGTSDIGWIVCPEPKIRHGEGFSWSGRVAKDARVVSAALGATRSKAPRVAVGFSQGAYLTVALLKKQKQHFRGVVLLGANVNPRAQVLRRTGVRRVVLGASADEPWRHALRARAKHLRQAGIEARFIDLGHVGHTYVARDPEVVREAIAWAAGG